MLLGQRLRALEGAVAPLPDTGSGITRDAGSIAVIEHDGSNYDMNTPDGVPNYGARAPVAQRFYQTHGDFYDFIVVFTNFAFETGEAQAFYNLVRNDVRGIGRPIGDNGALFGSPGRLKGYIDMADVDRWRQPGGAYSLRPGDPGFQVTMNVLAHELAHQWLADATYRNAAGQDSSDLLGKDGAHWSYLLDSDASVLYGSDWVPRGDGRFLAARTSSTYSSLDLYLMGFLDAAKLPPVTLLRNPDIDPKQTPILDAEVQAASETVTVQQLVAAMGPRTPDHRASPKEFRLGFVFLTRPGTEPDPADLAAVETVREHFAAHFFALTRGVALVDTSLAEAAGGPHAPSPDLDRALAWLLAQQTPEGSWRDAASTAIRDTSTVMDALAVMGRTDGAYQQALGWLGGVAPRPVDFMARRAGVLALSAGSAAARAPLLQSILDSQSADGGFGFAAGYTSDALDTALALRALSRLKQPVGSAVRKAIAVLAAQQLPTGGWPLVAGGEVSTVATAEVLLALQDWGGLPETQALVAPGLVALLTRRNPDGGFGESPSSPYGTALALQVLLRAGAPPDTINAAVAWLQARQLTDGSWDSSGYQTALVLGALRGGLAANLVVPADGLTLEPGSPVKEGLTVRVRARIRNTGRRPSSPTQARLYDAAPGPGSVVADAPVPALETGAESVVEFDLPTGDRAGERTIYVVADPDGLVSEAREDDNAASRALEIKGRLADLAVDAGDLAVAPDPPEDGETVELSVRVRNRGERSSPPNLVRFVRGNPRAGGVLLGQVPLPGLAVGQEVVVSITWDTTGQLGSHTLYALVDPAFSLFETIETNNETALPVRVTGAQPPGHDLEVAIVSFVPAALHTLPGTLEVRAVVRNLGRDAAAASVALYEGEDPVPGGEQAVTLGPRSSTTVVFALTVATPGNRTFTVRADPAGTLVETDETNTERTAVLADPQNTVDLEVRPEDVFTAPADVVIGQTLVVTAVVHNRGTSPVLNVPVVLRHGTFAGELARTTVSLSAGASASVTLRWTTTLSGDAVPLVVAVDPFGLLGELSEANNVSALAVRIAPSALTNLQTSGADIRFDPDPPHEGQAATVSTAVRNTSAVPSGPFTVRFYRGDPAQNGTPIGDSVVAGIAPAGSATAAITWSPVDARGTQGVFAVVDPLEAVAEYNEDDNRGFRPFSVLGLPDLALTLGQILLDPRYPRADEAVSIEATVRNFGQQASTETVLRAFSGEPGSGTEIGSALVPAVAPGGSARVTLSWTPDAPPGEKTLVLLADADDTVRETDEGNNRARLQVLVQDGDLFLTEAYFSPDGDGLLDHTRLGYRATGPVTVAVSNRAGRKVRTLAQDGPSSGSLQWDGTDDRGRLQPDGTYTFTLEGAQGAVLGRVQAFLDTNRESIHDAAGTGLLGVSNLSCDLPSELEGPVFMPNEDEVLFIVNYQSPGGQPFPLGLLRVGIDGQFDFVSRDDWYGGDVSFASLRAVSPDGREVLVSKSDDLFAVDLLTGARRALATGGWTGAARWSPDGRWIATVNQVLARDGTVVTDLPPDFPSFRGAWSPDSKWIAAGNHIVSRDGSVVRTIPLGEDLGVTAAFDTVWRGDGKIAAYIGTHCGDGCGAAAVFVIDPDTDTATELAWLGERRNDFARAPIGWSADGARLLYNLYNDGDKGSFVAREDGSSPLLLLRQSVALSPRSAAATYGAEADPGAGCSGSYDSFAAFSLQNLTVGLRPSRLPANNGILVKATVSDRYLSHHQLEYALSATPDVWVPIGPASEVPVLDDVLTVWVPPSPGTYLLRLSAVDRAGNVRSRTRIVAWDRVPLLANITQTESLLSPNGDGTRDDVTFNYLVIEPTTAEVRIVGPISAATAGSPPPLVRRFSLEHPAVGPASFPWDGRDESGVTALDGRYTVFINDLPFRVTVDATPPDIAWSYENLRVEQGRLVADRRARVVDPRLEDWSVGIGFGGSEQVYEPLRDEVGEIVYADGVPRMILVAGAPVSQRVRAPEGAAGRSDNEVYNLATDPGAILTAGDYAGNRSSLAILPVEEKLALLVAADHAGPLREDKVFKLPPRTAFVLAETIRGTPEAGETVRFQYQLRTGGAWAEGRPFALDREVAWPADFAQIGLILGREYRGRFVTHARGRDFSTQEFLFRPCMEAFELDLAIFKANLQRVIWNLTLAADAPEPLVSATLTITGSGKLSGYRAVQPFVLGEENYVVTPPPSRRAG